MCVPSEQGLIGRANIACMGALSKGNNLTAHTHCPFLLVTKEMNRLGLIYLSIIVKFATVSGAGLLSSGSVHSTDKTAGE